MNPSEKLARNALHHIMTGAPAPDPAEFTPAEREEAIELLNRHVEDYKAIGEYHLRAKFEDAINLIKEG